MNENSSQRDALQSHTAECRGARRASPAWRDCRIGSCHRHEDCMYRPCRSGHRDNVAQTGDPPWFEKPEMRSWTQPYVDAGHDIASLFGAAAFCVRCGLGQIDLSEDGWYGAIRQCLPPVDLEADAAGYHQAQADWLRANGWVEGESGWVMTHGFCKPLPLDSAHRLAQIFEELDNEPD